MRPALSAGLVAAALVAAAWPAEAATKSYSYRVELAETAKKSQARAGGVTWACRGRYCITSAPGGNVSVRGCRELAGQVGRIISYRSEIKELGGDQIDACNAVPSDAGSERRTPVATAGPAATATRPEPPRVTTEELTFTGVHNWSPAR